MKFAYADPPYLGQCSRYEHHHPDARCWDHLETHAALLARMNAEYPDGWVYSLSSPSLQTLLPVAPLGVRVGAWTKPFAVFKPNVNPAYAWEPVLFKGGRKGDRTRKTVRDWCAVNITLKKGLVGAKPPAFCHWLFDLLGAEQGDELHDLFPGTGIVSREWNERFPKIEAA